MQIRTATESDISAILRIERAAPTAAHWTEAQYRARIAEGLVWIAIDDIGPAAFLAARSILKQCELENVVVDAACRRRGVAKLLLSALLARAVQIGCEEILLEVRSSNKAARRLYSSSGFTEVGTRKAYYRDPQEDAILYRIPLV
jgi:[ribosomal protein S18]-alanine N-acetyltransferase